MYKEYEVGDIIINTEGSKFFVSRSRDKLHYTIVDRSHNNQRLVVRKATLHTYTKLTLSSALKNL